MLEPAKKNKGEGASSVHTRCTVKNMDKKQKSREIVFHGGRTQNYLWVFLIWFEDSEFSTQKLHSEMFEKEK